MNKETVLRGNKGEWSEIYTLIKVLAEGKLYGADAELNKIENLCYKILQVIRQEKGNNKYFYQRKDAQIILLGDNSEELIRFDTSIFEDEANYLLSEIKKVSGQGKNKIPTINEFLETIKITSLKAPSSTKSDITIQVHDVYTGAEPILDFSIKSQIGSPSTLLNASKATNFIFRISSPISKTQIQKINKLELTSDRIKEIELLSNLEFYKCENDVFFRNLRMIDTNMPKIIASLLYGFNKFKNSNIKELISDYQELFEDEKDIVEYKVKQLLVSSALGMIPSLKWSGYDEATGGYIVVKSDGELVCYHLYNRNALKDFLYNNTKLENGSRGRHDFGYIYIGKDRGQYLKLNLQVRFKK